MSISLELPIILEDQLEFYCSNNGVTAHEVIQKAVHDFLNHSPTAYELGIEGFGADHTHSGDIARNSQRLLREHLRATNTG